MKDTSDVHYIKLPYIVNLSHYIKNRLSKLCKEFCKENFNIKLVFTLFKIKNCISYKDPIPDDLKSFLVYKLTCVSCSSSYIGKIYCHFKTRIEELIKKDNKSHILKHLHSTATCFGSYNSLSFKIIGKANSKFDLKIKEVLHINWTKPNLNAQESHLALTLSLKSLSTLFFSVFVFFFYVSSSSIILINSETNYRHLFLSCLHFVITLSHYQHTLYETFLFDLLFSLSLR